MDERKKGSGKVVRILCSVLAVVFFLMAAFLAFCGWAVQTESDSKDGSTAAFNAYEGGDELQSLEIYLLTESFAAQGLNQEFYLACDADENWYVVSMPKEDFGEYQEIYEYTYSEEAVENPPSAVITGYPVELDSDLLGFAAEFMNMAFFDGEEMITAENCSEYIGTYYLDATSAANGGGAWVLYVLALFPAALGILMIVICVNSKTAAARALAAGQQRGAGYAGEGYGMESPYRSYDAAEANRNPEIADSMEAGAGVDLAGVPVSENVLFGIVGAVLGSLVGAALWIVIYQAGYLVGIAGYLAVLWAMRLYRKFAGNLSRPGTVICVIVALLMLGFANVFACSWAIAREVNKLYPNTTTIGYVLSNFGAMMDKLDMWGSFAGDLVIGLLLALVAGISSLIGKKGKKTK